MDRRTVLYCLTAMLTACAGGHRPLTVASKNFTEQVILGEIVAQYLEHKLGHPVSRKLNLGGTLLAHNALVSGEIDLYPEYTGTAITTILKDKSYPDHASVLARVRTLYRRNWRIEWLPPLGFDNPFAMVVREEDAVAHHLETLTAAANSSIAWRLGIGYEFLQRPDGYPALNAKYHFKYAAPPISMDLGLLYRALEQKQVNMAAGSATDGLLSARPFRVLRDDQHAFPPYQACLAVRSAAFERYPGLKPALENLSGKISTETMRRLNYQVDGEHKPVREVASAFLKSAGLL
ncbi:MAG: ABC transporter substrate-binding protein [Bryobacterales bacterium]|nr:ABC transporter substrate-binding protein [Bryobacterales bacterium]